jgi:hypothetical protein
MLRAKSNVLASLLRRLERDGTAASYIDLRVPTSPAVSPVAPVITVEPVVPSLPVDEAAPSEPVAEVAPTDATAETAIPDGVDPAAEDEEAPSDATVAD